MELLTKPASYNAQKVLITAEYTKSDVKPVTEVSEAAVKELAPIGKLPVLKAKEGHLVNSSAIAKYLVAGSSADTKAKLLGTSAFEQASVESWLEYCSNDVEIPAVVVSYTIVGWMQKNDAAFEKARKDLNKTLKALDDHLKTRTFLVTEKDLSLADIFIATSLVLPFKLVLDPKMRKTFTNVTRWFTTCVNRPEFVAVLGQTELCTKSLAPESKGAKKASKPKNEKAAKPETAAAKPAPAQAAPKKKEKKYYELLPKSSFVLDVWKKKYSNPTGDDCYNSMPWFWENLDYEGWSIYYSDYKYNDELEVAFMVSNLCGGFVQRCDEIRKYAFGVLQILEDGKKFQIKGAWLFRGDSEKLMLDANPDAETYIWTKADPKNPQDQQKIADLWCAGETVEGKPIADCKVFK